MVQHSPEPQESAQASQPLAGCCGFLTEHYELYSNKWDHSDLTYCFDYYPDDVPPEKTRKVIKAALDKWAKVTCLTFTELAPHKAKVDIRIGWYRGEHGDNKRFLDGLDEDGESVQAHAYPPPPSEYAGKVHFNLAKAPWGAKLDAVALHEFGHMLGLYHSTVEEAVMYKHLYTSRTELHPDDIAGIEAKYGLCEPPWSRLLPPSKAVRIAASETGLFRFDKGGWIYKHSGTPGSYWELIDKSAYTAEIKCNKQAMFQRHENGQIWKYNTEVLGNWEFVDRGDGNVEMAPARGGRNLYQRHQNGQIWLLEPKRAWEHLGTVQGAVQLVANAKSAFVLCSDGKIQMHLLGKTWHPLGEDSRTVQILADGWVLYRLTSNGRIYSNPSRIDGDPGTWDEISGSGHPVEIAANGRDVIQRTENGEIMRYTGDPGRWYSLGNRPRVCQLAAGDGRFFYLTTDGEVWAMNQ